MLKKFGVKQNETDPFEWFQDKKVNDTLTVKIINTDNRGLVVKPEGSNIELQIKKSQIAINAADARPSRFTGGERIDCAIQEIDLKKRIKWSNVSAKKALVFESDNLKQISFRINQN